MPGSIKLDIQIRYSGIETVGLIYQSNIGLFNLTDMGLGSRKGALKIGTVSSSGI
jgi:hypothetical protein